MFLEFNIIASSLPTLWLFQLHYQWLFYQVLFFCSTTIKIEKRWFARILLIEFLLNHPYFSIKKSMIHRISFLQQANIEINGDKFTQSYFSKSYNLSITIVSSLQCELCLTYKYKYKYSYLQLCKKPSNSVKE